MRLISLPIACLSHNRYYRIYQGRYVISKVGRVFRETVRRYLEGFYQTKGKIKLEITFNFKDHRKRDLDNLNKSIIDAMKGHLFEDDSEIYVLNTSKTLGTEDSTLISISELL
jgi:Holliday junction resolvase RusA-like endonuclease